MQNPPTIRIGGQVSKSLYQFSMQSPDQRASCTRRPRKLREGARRACRASGRDERPRRSPARRSTSTSIATRPPRSASPRTRSRTRSTTRTARAGCRRSTRRSTSTRCCSSWRREFQADPTRAVAAVLQSGSGRQRPGRAARHAGARSRQRSGRRRSTTTASCRPSRSRSAWRRAPRSATC